MNLRQGFQVWRQSRIRIDDMLDLCSTHLDMIQEKVGRLTQSNVRHVCATWARSEEEYRQLKFTLEARVTL